MKNNLYAAFTKKPQEPARLENCLIETEDEEEFKKALLRAKEQGLEITRIYNPGTEIEFPDFIGAINI